MEKSDKEAKTEEPTEKRIKDSLEDGNVPVSREIATAVSILTFCTVYILYGKDIANGLINAMANIVTGNIGTDPVSNQDIIAMFARLGVAIAVLLGPLFLALMVMAIISSAAQNEPRLVIKRITPEFSRVSPTAGWGRLFSMKSFMEFLKSFIKILAAILIVTLAMMPALKDIQASMYQLPMASIASLWEMIGDLLVWVSSVSIAIAAFDFVWQRYSWWADLRMTRQEMKDEFKQSEGDPIVKSRLRAMSRDRSRSRMMQAVPKATLIVANPTHFAIALRYNRENDAAPMVLAKGTDLIALRIKEIAEENSIPIFERVELARALYKVVKVDQVIPAQFYKALAELISAIYSKRV